MIVYFSGATENTKNFVEKTGLPAQRIHLRRGDPRLHVDSPYVLILPTYGGGEQRGAVPKQVIEFLNVENNRKHCIGVIATGNMNFGETYCLAGKIVAQKLRVPLLYCLELRGTPEDVEKVRSGVEKMLKDEYLKRQPRYSFSKSSFHTPT